MTTESVTINLDPEAARIYKSASPQERRKLELLVSLQLRAAAREGLSLQELADEVSRRAQQRGLTQEILEEILNKE
jgi:hypothetical protein